MVLSAKRLEFLLEATFIFVTPKLIVSSLPYGSIVMIPAGPDDHSTSLWFTFLKSSVPLSSNPL